MLRNVLKDFERWRMCTHKVKCMMDKLIVSVIVKDRDYCLCWPSASLSDVTATVRADSLPVLLSGFMYVCMSTV